MEEIKEQNQRLQESIAEMMAMFTGMRSEIDAIKEVQARGGSRTSRSRSRSRDSSASRSQSRSRRRDRDNHSQRGRSRRSLDRSRSRSRRSRDRSRGRSRRSRDRSRSGASSHRRERSRSRSWPSPPPSRLWADIMDEEDASVGASKLVTVSEKTEATLKECFTQGLKNPKRIGIRDAYGLPKVLATKTPQLESFIKEEIPQTAKTMDKELARIHTFLLDAVAPLTALLDKPDNLHPEVIKVIESACKLLGNASTKMSTLRREKVITSFNKSLLPLAKEEGQFKEAAPGLFGTEFAERCKTHVDQVKAMRSSLSKKDGNNSSERKSTFFRGGPSQRRGGQSNQSNQRGGYHQQSRYRQQWGQKNGNQRTQRNQRTQ